MLKRASGKKDDVVIIKKEGLPPEIEKAVRKKVTDVPGPGDEQHVDKMHEGQMSPHYIIINQQQPVPPKTFFSTGFGKVVKAGIVLAVVGAMAAFAFFGVQRMGGPIQEPDPPQQVVPVQRVDARDPTLPTTSGTLPADSQDSSTAPDSTTGLPTTRSLPNNNPNPNGSTTHPARDLQRRGGNLTGNRINTP